jgi:hypothetical protein
MRHDEISGESGSRALADRRQRPRSAHGDGKGHAGAALRACAAGAGLPMTGMHERLASYLQATVRRAVGAQPAEMDRRARHRLTALLSVTNTSPEPRGAVT